jgi:hypothetical protein
MEAEQEAAKHLESAAQNDRWMMSAWAVVDGKVQMIRRVCWNFPKGDMMEALALLAHNFFEESKLGDKLPDTPLPRARLPFRPGFGGGVAEELVEKGAEIIDPIPSEDAVRSVSFPHSEQGDGLPPDREVFKELDDRSGNLDEEVLDGN